MTASFDGEEPVEVLLWESDGSSPNFKPDSTNETVIVDLDNPLGAASVVLTFGLFDAGNDWWWAIDNVEVSGVLPEPVPVNPGTAGLVAYYAFDNDANDSSGNDNHGTIVGTGTEWVTGYVNGALLFKDGAGYVEVPDSPSLNPTDEVTIAAWVNPTWTGNNRVLQKGSSDNQYRFLRENGDNFVFHLSGVGRLEGIACPPENEWHHVAATYNGSAMKIYYDGELVAEQAASGPIGTSSDPLFIGTKHATAPAGDYFYGILDEVAFYNRALSVGEIRYLAGERAVDPSLVIYYSFDEVGEIVADQSGKGHDGVVVGDVTAEPEGKYNGAANFASGSYLDLDGPSFPAEDIPTSAMTLAAWIKIANTGGDHEIFSARASDGSWLIHPEPKSSGDIRWLLRSYGGTTIFQIRAGTVTWDEWLHFAGTYDKASGKAALYINGELIEEMDVASPADIAGDWDLGARVGLTIDNGRPFTGLMDEFRMYTRALSQDEILTIMQGM
ncbi:MAG: LamG domain-containing protein [Planctomycetota bacterium]